MTEEKIQVSTEENKKIIARRQAAFIPRFSLVWKVALFYLGAITLAEFFTTQIEPRLGLVLHGVIFLVLLLQSAMSDHIETQRFLLALALAPLTRLLSLMMPLQQFPLVYWYLLVGVPLFMAAIIAAKAGQIKWVSMGLTMRKLPFQVLFGMTGIGLGYLEYLILRPESLIEALRLELIWLPALVLLIFTGLLEEIIFRGLLQYTAVSKLGQGGLVYTAAVFAVLHIGYHSWLDIAFVFAVGLLFGWAVRYSGSILGVTLAHGLTNISLFLVFPFLLAAPSPLAPASLSIEPPVQMSLEGIRELSDHPLGLSQPWLDVAAPDPFSSVASQEAYPFVTYFTNLTISNDVSDLLIYCSLNDTVDMDLKY